MMTPEKAAALVRKIRDDDRLQNGPQYWFELMCALLKGFEALKADIGKHPCYVCEREIWAQ